MIGVKKYKNEIVIREILMKKDILKCILMNDEVVNSINNKLDLILDFIPEIRSMIDFPHNHPHHHLDVWNHTLLALNFAPKDFEIRLVLLLHDIGKPYSYQEGEVRHFKEHSFISAKMAKNILKRLDFEEQEISELYYLIEQHDTPITIDEIKNNKPLTIKKFKVQCCDALAHHPDKLEKRKNYLLLINEILNDEKKDYYQQFILSMPPKDKKHIKRLKY